ncbi:RNA methyltransferase [Pseudoxanthobacter sp.]|uniref:RNA methyltransferase n=1 Tax=Pseudoxanthobacter sp. TaxID=1925742 RepID=UPI002FDFAA37
MTDTDAAAEAAGSPFSHPAGADFAALPPPVVVLVETQMAENIGTAIRAMANFGLKELRLVKPRDGWPNERGIAAASRSEAALSSISVWDTLEDAIADCDLVLATTRRERDMIKEVIGPDAAAGRAMAAGAAGRRTAILFGRERIGLTNDEVVLCDAIVTLPVDPQFASLNIAQAVLILAYEWRRAITGGALPFSTFDGGEPATKGELIGLFAHLEEALEAAGYFRSEDKRAVAVRSLRNIFGRTALSGGEVRTLRGIVAALEGRPTRPHKTKGPATTLPRPTPAAAEEGDDGVN